MASTGSSDLDDRLSALPDDLICRILYFLPTKTSVSTSVLAQRWRLLWAHVARLDFDSQKHKIISRVMMRLKSQDLNAFRLSNGDCSSYNLESWVTTLIDRRVQKLTIHMTKNPKWERDNVCKYCREYDNEYYERLLVELPRRLFSCKTLVELSLANCQLKVPMTGTIYLLPALKSLLLENVKYGSDESLPRLLSYCPVLVNLTILRDRYRSSYEMCCYVSSPTIKRLVVRQLADMDELKLDTPALRYLHLLGCVSENPSSGVLPSLTRARVTFSPPSVVNLHNILQFVSGLKNAKNLEVSFFEMKSFQIPDSRFSAFNIVKFHNLTHLKLNTDYRFIPMFLESADNLRVLTVSCEKNDFKRWVEREQVPACLVSNLRKLKFLHFGCSVEQDFNMVRYFLRNAKVLKKMEICCKHRGLEAEKRNEAHESISLFERVSEACEIVFL